MFNVILMYYNNIIVVVNTLL